MRVKLYFTAFLLMGMQLSYAQDSIQYRVILIGDAGEINPEQKAILADAASRALPGKTLALFLGDNIYPRGLETEKSTQVLSEAVLQSQYETLRKNNVPVYFVPGNHDWDKSGPMGYEKMRVVNAFLQRQQDSLLKMIPEDACPGPYELSVTDNLVIVAMDSEWWLYPFDTHADRSDCVCKTKRDVLGLLEDILLRNNGKIILFATHHPFKSHGVHGGHYTIKDHIFPLTNLGSNLYIPLPVIGSLYPLLRKGFPPAEDLGNALYKDMQQSLTAVLKKYPNVIQVSGHEHTLQLIKGDVLQVVSGAGSRHTSVKKATESIYAAGSGGYVIADILKDSSVQLTYLKQSGETIKEDFVYKKPYTVSPATEIFLSETITPDTVHVALKTKYDKVSKVHRNLFGKNYRKVWAAQTAFPALKISAAGFTPKERGGGMQTHSLRLTDKNNKEWVLRSIEKFPDALLPQALNQTLASEILEDNFSANFPYGPLVVPVFADALGVAHSTPSLVYIAFDKQLGIYSKEFSNTVALMEEREPLGKSASTVKMQEKLKEDNDNSVDQQQFLVARIQDIFLGDWDRHGDQWRWIEHEKGKVKTYKPVPRDRDQVFYVNQGLFPKILSLPWLEPKLQGFGERVRNINTFSFNARLLDGLYTNALSYEDWNSATQFAVNTLTDSLIEAALKKLPSNIYQQSHDRLFYQLQKRRQDLLRVMPLYYKFINKIIDITTSDKNEQVIINDTLNGKLKLTIYKINSEKEISRLLYTRVFDPAVTKELRLFVAGGKDQVIINNNSSPVTVRIVGDGATEKLYQFNGQPKYLRKIHVYDGDSNAVFQGQYNSVHRHLSNDPANTALQLTNRYNKTIPLFSAGYNVDDGLIIGAGVKWITQGFRKQPYAAVQQFFIAHSFFSNAYRINYKGEWTKLLGNADFTLKANAYAPDNTQNFFGRGNETPFDKTGDYRTYYRVKFDQFTLNPAVRWKSRKGNSFSIGPSFQYYHFDPDDNVGRFITNTSLLHTYDSATLHNDKTHAGVVADFTHDGRNSIIFPSYGNYVNFQAQGYAGLNHYSKSYLQVTGLFAFYKSIDRKSNIIFSNRTGGGYTVGNSAFYQSLFLGGHTNLQGYHQFRYSGEHMLYNNSELRIKLANLASYILPGQLGMVGFYDIGRVWQNGYNTSAWHQGFGGGLYFAPAGLFVFQLVAGKSDEGWYPYFTAGVRF